MPNNLAHHMPNRTGLWSSSPLGQLIHPYRPKDFLSEIREKKVLYVPEAANPDLPSLINSLVSIDQLDALLAGVFTVGLREERAVRLSRDGKLISADDFTRRQVGTFVEFDAARILTHFRAGASITLTGVHELLPPVTDLCADLSHELGGKVHANVYITPPRAQGFPLHIDTHDVFILQIAGSKGWDVHSPIVDLPIRRMHTDCSSLQTAPVERVDLKIGELLYLPRGFPHRGVSSDETSVHLTIGMHPYTWADLMRDVLTDLEVDDVKLRSSINPSLAEPDCSVEDPLKAALSVLSGALLDRELVGSTAQRHAAAVAPHGGKNLRGQFSTAIQSGDIGLASCVQVSPASDPRIDVFQSRVMLSFAGKMLSLPAFTEPHLRALCDGNPIRVDQLPHGIDAAGLVVLVRRLVREGLLEVVEPIARQDVVRPPSHHRGRSPV
ncbi:hypothetical protein StrepF001_14755 [Streptomyces sp. F001]|uniref:cupin domain-containing protein n=1 Tax=Streptomyces sp. F001 TaxID=1510026 RepID=UPI00101E5199|nr:cupin domain-containing protein [Streptomyces sp. F001]RZB18345.1 hypothetical protein StrepF001_14755 [Streptomyces sp. F001]